MSNTQYNSSIDEEIYFVVCTDRPEDNHEINIARAIELEMLVGSSGLSRSVQQVNGKRVCQTERKFATGNRDGSLAYNTLFGQSLAKAFGTKVWLHHDGDGEFLLTGNSVEKVAGGLNTAIETLIGEKIEEVQNICNYPANDGSLAQHTRGVIAGYLRDEGVNGIASLVKDEFEASSGIISPERQAVKEQIISTIN